ncbi:MAG TPA: GNAT family N-acetyltransferase [Candidatus Acidoferrum sp.]|nr:GNAT family N-acetyltransferase [Candidatus Acidoferrum sp.]
MDNERRRRFEMVVDNEVAFVSYAREDERLVLVHTVVPQALAGRGIGTALARAVLEEMRRRGQRVVPRCEFIAAFIARHPEFADLVAEE